MNKTVTINISGIIFHIEEDAYEKLSKYLATIKSYFSLTDGGSEIMADIEARIAEMLQARTSAVKQVVLMADVDAVMEAMGRPEEFAGEETRQEQTADGGQSSGETKKRLYRDPDHKVIGGVCSGIAAYFDVDVVWIRIAMFLLLFFGGMSLWVYIILWIVIPEARTTAEKLAMRGEKADIHNIRRSVMEEAEQMKKRMEKYGNDFRNNPDARNFFDKLADFFKDLLFFLGKFFGRLVGLVLLVFGVMFMFSLVATAFGFSVMGSNAEFNDWIALVFNQRSHYTLGMLGLILCAGIPVLLLIYGGIKLLFKIRYSNRWLNLSAGMVWLAGLIIVTFVVITTLKDFSEQGKVKEQVALVQKDIFYLKLNKNYNIASSLEIHGADFDVDEREGRWGRRDRRNGDYLIGRKDEQRQIVGYAELNIVPSLTDNFELVIIKRARGEDKRAAVEAAKSIEYKVVQNDSLLNFDQLFLVEPGEKFRVQDVQVVLKVPRNKMIYLDNSLESFIYDIENVTNTYDADMLGRRWAMTKDGLACVDCEGIGSDEEIPAAPQPPARPVLNINDKDAKVKIGRDEIDIKSKDADVKIGKDGIHINTHEGRK